MASGGKTEIINTRERAVSTDINRLQAFAAFDNAEIWRRLMDNQIVPLVDQLGGGLLEQGSYVNTDAMDVVAIGTPLYGAVIEGLVVTPVAGTTSLLVSAGCAWLDDPDGQAGSSDPNPPDPDDSRYKLVVDPGIQTAGVLVMSAGGGGGTTIYVVECQRTETVIETDSRDVFDPSTGVFVPVVVNKVIAGRMNYRLRAGTPGTGLVGTGIVQGWMPICVAAMPASGSTVDDATFWDVRPLVKDRVNAPADSQHQFNFLMGDMRALCNQITDPAKSLVIGTISSQIGMYRAGGRLTLDLQDPDNQEAGYTPVDGTLAFVYAVFPLGLPRWVRYADFPASPRVPQGPQGIIVVSSIGPAQQTGAAALNLITPPTTTGLGAAPGPSALLAATWVFDNGATIGQLSFTANEGLISISDRGEIPQVTSAATIGSTDRFILEQNIHYPKNARSVLVKIFGNFSGGSASADAVFGIDVAVAEPGTSLRLFTAPGPVSSQVKYTGTGTYQITGIFEIPTMFFASTTGFADDDLTLVVDWGTNLTRVAVQATPIGWRL